MKLPLFTVATAIALVAAPALAREARLVTRLFSEDQVVRIDGRAGVQTTITFGEDEHIENVAIGNSATWQVTPNKRANLLFVKPLLQRGRTNLTVVTDRRTYLFDLVAGGGGAPVYVLRFTYPAEAKRAVSQLATGTMSELEAQAAARPPQEVAADPAQLNFAWRARGSRKLVPGRIYDDGNSTYLAWDQASQLPAILIRNERGEEGAANYAVRDGVIVLDAVPPAIVLRAGRETATLENQGKPRVPASAPPAAPGLVVPGQTAPSPALSLARPEGQ